MIRKFQKNDIDDVMKIWLEGNIKIHSFVNASYWNENFELVKGLMLESEMYVSENNGVITGFIGMMDHMIAGIFVCSDYQSQGIGKLFISEMKMKYSRLILQVYKKNEKAIKFYEREGFTIISEQMDELTNEVEFVMEWNSNKNETI